MRCLLGETKKYIYEVFGTQQIALACSRPKHNDDDSSSGTPRARPDSRSPPSSYASCAAIRLRNSKGVFAIVVTMDIRGYYPGIQVVCGPISANVPRRHTLLPSYIIKLPLRDGNHGIDLSKLPSDTIKLPSAPWY